MHRACTRLRQRNPNLFIVESLFANNEQGVWYDPSDMNTLFQDDAGTIPVTASGQTVGRMLDKSGRGNHATQSNAGSRPTFRDVGGLRYLELDGVDDFMVTANINFTATDKISAFAGMRKSSDAATGLFAELSVDSFATNGTIGIYGPAAAGATKFQFSSRGTGVRLATTTSTAFNAPITVVFSGIGDIGGDVSNLRLNGAQINLNGDDQGAGNYGNHPLYIGRRGGTTLAFNGHLYGLIIRGTLTDSANTSAAERYLAAKSGVTLV